MSNPLKLIIGAVAAVFVIGFVFTLFKNLLFWGIVLGIGYFVVKQVLPGLRKGKEEEAEQ